MREGARNEDRRCESIVVTTRVDNDNLGCHHDGMTPGSHLHEETIERIKEARAQAIEHARQARRFHEERRALMRQLIDDGWSQADIARELGVTRQAVQKMMSL